MMRHVDMTSDATSIRHEVQQIFASFGLQDDERLSYEQFVILLTLIDEQTAFFRGLHTFANDAVKIGVQDMLHGVGGHAASQPNVVCDDLSCHILDDGSQAWRQSVEAAFSLVDRDDGGSICKAELLAAVAKYPLISQLMRLPVGLSEAEKIHHMEKLYDAIDVDGNDDICEHEWLSFFCRDRQTTNCVSEPTAWDPARPECAAITGFIFDCDGTLYQPSGLIPGALDALTWLEREAHPFVMLSNTGAKPNAAVDAKLARLGCTPDGAPLPAGRCYTAAEAQVTFMLSPGQLPPGSKLLLLAPDERCVEMLRERDGELFDSWDLRRSMDVDTAKEWSVHAEARLRWEVAHAAGEAAGAPPPKVAVVFFHDGALGRDSSWSYDLFEAMTILLTFGAEFIYTADDPTNPSIDPRYPGKVFPQPGPGMFVEMLKKAMPPLSHARCFCSGKGGNVGRRFMIDRAIEMLKEQGHSGERDKIMIVGDRFDTDMRAGVLAGIQTCLLESGAHTLAVASEFPTDIPSFTCPSIADLAP